MVMRNDSWGNLEKFFFFFSVIKIVHLKLLFTKSDVSIRLFEKKGIFTLSPFLKSNKKRQKSILDNCIVLTAVQTILYYCLRFCIKIESRFPVFQLPPFVISNFLFYEIYFTTKKFGIKHLYSKPDCLTKIAKECLF